MIGTVKQSERLKDWTFRYQYIYRKRRTNKQKQRFLSALAADVAKIRPDIKIIEYKQNKKYISSNLYVGNIETADQIICTYFDTPPKSRRPYYLFDREKQRRGLTISIAVTSLITLLIGVLVTLLYVKNASNRIFDLSSVTTWLAVLFYGIFFYLFSKITKGLSSRKNLIRNTSSILSLLTLIDEVKKQKVAFAFVDEGCFGELGLEVLKDSCKTFAEIYLLDCVGADLDLHFIGSTDNLDRQKQFVFHQQPTKQVRYIFGARVLESVQGNQYYLKTSDLNQKKIKVENLVKIIDLFK